MSSFFQLFMAWGLLLVFVLMLYLVDKVNVIYQGYATPDMPKTYNDGLFGELSGKTLWDAMSGIPVPGVEAKLATSLKPHYEPVLRQHIEQVFMEGFHHGKAGTAGVPTNNRIIPTPRGSIESWLPMHHLASIYQAGVDFAANNPEDDLRIQQSLDQVTAMIYARTGLELTEAYSTTLLIRTDEQDDQLPPPEMELIAAEPMVAAESMVAPPSLEPQALQPDLSKLKPPALEPVATAAEGEQTTAPEESKPVPA